MYHFFFIKIPNHSLDYDDKNGRMELGAITFPASSFPPGTAPKSLDPSSPNPRQVLHARYGSESGATRHSILVSTALFVFLHTHTHTHIHPHTHTHTLHIHIHTHTHMHTHTRILVFRLPPFHPPASPPGLSPDTRFFPFPAAPPLDRGAEGSADSRREEGREGRGGGREAAGAGGRLRLPLPP